MSTDVTDIPFCFTNVIDNTNLGEEYYHNVQSLNLDVIKMVPRIPVRYDLHDAESVKLKSKGDAQKLLGIPNLSSTSTYYHIKRTLRSKVNTFLSNVLAVVLIVASLVNMKRILRVLQNDTTLTNYDRVLFRWGFVLSFLVVFVLTCYLVLAWFELYRSRSGFPQLHAHGFRFLDLNSNLSLIKFLIYFFVFVIVIIAIMETINIMIAEKNIAILLLFLPIVACMLLLVWVFTSTLPQANAQPKNNAPQTTTAAQGNKNAPQKGNKTQGYRAQQQQQQVKAQQQGARQLPGRS